MSGTKRKRDDPMSDSTPSKKFKPKKSKKPNGGGNFATKDFVKKYLKKNQELKFIHTDHGVTSVDWSGTLYDLCSIAQGDTDGTRDGDTIMPTSLYLRGSFVLGDNTNTMRFIIFRWLDSTTPAASDIFQGGLGSLFAPYSPMNVDGRAKFNVLYDQFIKLGSGDNIQLLDQTLSLAAKPIQYAAGTTTGTNKIYAVVVSDSGAASHPGAAWCHQLRFTDS